MHRKRQVLVVTNAITDEEVAEIKASFLQDHHPSRMPIKLSIVHVIPTLPTCYFNIPSMGILIEKYYDEAKHTLNQVGKLLNIGKKDQWLISGRIRTEVLRLANRLGSHFILASAQEIQELQRSLFFKNIYQYNLTRSSNKTSQQQ